MKVNPVTYQMMLLVLVGLMGCDSSDQVNDPILTVSANDLTVSEGVNVALDVQLDNTSSDEVVILYQTEDGSALTTNDYHTDSGTLVFAPGERRKVISLSLIDDEVPEDDEEFYLTLSTENPNVVFNPNLITVTILDDDEPTNELILPTTGYTTPTSYEGMSLVWADEFEGNSLNTNDWTYEIGTGSNGWGNNELQYYTDQNTSIVDGNLVITAKKENVGGRTYTSSRIITENKQEFQYGRIDIRAVLPEGKGIWPALWMLGSNFSNVGWPACGEIDIMEMIGGEEQTVHGTVHWSNNGSYAAHSDKYSLSSGIFRDEYHVFSIVWNEQSITWYMDDIQYNSINITPDELSEFRASFFFIVNLAVGGNWPGNPDADTVFPQYLAVDYIRVFQTN